MNKPNYISENIAICAYANWKYYNIPDTFKKWVMNGLYKKVKPDIRKNNKERKMF